MGPWVHLLDLIKRRGGSQSHPENEIVVIETGIETQKAVQRKTVRKGKGYPLGGHHINTKMEI